MINCKKDEWNLKNIDIVIWLIYYVVNWNFKYKNFKIWLKIVRRKL